MSFLSSAAKVAGSLAAPVVSGALSAFGVQKQNEGSERAYKNRYQWQVNDLRKAGLNPILAASLGAGAGPQVQNVWSPAVSSFWNAAQSGAGVGLAQAQAEQSSAQAEKARMEVGKVAAEIQEIAENIRRSEATRVKLGEEVRNLEVGRDLTEVEIKRVTEVIPLVLAQRAESLARAYQLNASGDSVAAEATLKRILADFYEDHPGLYLTKDGASAVTSVIGTLLKQFGRSGRSGR